MHEDDSTFKELAASCRESVAVSAHSIFNNEIMSDEIRSTILNTDPCIVCGFSPCPVRHGR
jgi:hypothetical protein